MLFLDISKNSNLVDKEGVRLPDLVPKGVWCNVRLLSGTQGKNLKDRFQPRACQARVYFIVFCFMMWDAGQQCTNAV